MFVALFQDGKIASETTVECHVEGTPQSGSIAIREPGVRHPIVRWQQADLFTVPGPQGTLRIGCKGQLPGARLIVTDPDVVHIAKAQLPGLERQRSADRFRQVQLIVLSMAALVAVLSAYVFGIPLIANRALGLISPQWETQLGETVADQVAEIFGGEDGIVLCDPNPNSIANQAIERFRQRTLEGIVTPFDVRIAVIKSDVPNAIALPGGRIYYFSEMLESTHSPDEFAGVLAHEIGHVVERHGMEQLIASAGTGLLVGMVLGDVTGISLAGALGSMVVDNHFSREHELAADRFAREAAARLGFNPLAMADLLERVSEEDDFDRALSLLSTHPLSDDRRAALSAPSSSKPRFDGAFSPKEWYAISEMCD